MDPDPLKLACEQFLTTVFSYSIVAPLLIFVCLYFFARYGIRYLLYFSLQNELKQQIENRLKYDDSILKTIQGTISDDIPPAIR